MLMMCIKKLLDNLNKAVINKDSLSLILILCLHFILLQIFSFLLNLYMLKISLTLKQRNYFLRFFLKLGY